MGNLKVGDRVKVCGGKIYTVVGFDVPLPKTGGVSYVLICSTKGKVKRVNENKLEKI